MTPSSPPDSCVAVVVAYRSAATLGPCLTALLADPAVQEVVVVDNSSEPATRTVVEALQASGSERLVHVDPGRNLGFAAACNLGIARSSAPVVALVNPDVRLTRSLAPLLTLLQGPAVSVVSGGLTAADGSLGNARSDATLLLELRRALLGTPAVTPVPVDGAVHEVPQVDGALLLVARDVLTRHGGLAELFPLYYEDVELCWRLRRAGGRVRLHGMVYGHHEGGVSSAQNPRAHLALRVSRLRWLRLRHGRLGAAVGTALAALELVTRAVGRTPEGARTRWRAVRACAAELRRPLSQHPLEDHGTPRVGQER